MTTFAEEIERRRIEWLTRLPPAVSNGDLRVLREMSGDFNVHQWARRLNTTVLEIERACAWLNVKCQAWEKKKK